MGCLLVDLQSSPWLVGIFCGSYLGRMEEMLETGQILSKMVALSSYLCLLLAFPTMMSRDSILIFSFEMHSQES